MVSARLGKRGQVTIPKPLRERLGLRAGDVLEFDEEGGRLVARKVTPRDRLDAVYGILGRRRRADALVEQMRGPGPRRRR